MYMQMIFNIYFYVDIAKETNAFLTLHPKETT